MREKSGNEVRPTTEMDENGAHQDLNLDVLPIGCCDLSRLDLVLEAVRIERINSAVGRLRLRVH